jgi:hypothetical protein
MDIFWIMFEKNITHIFTIYITISLTRVNPTVQNCFYINYRGSKIIKINLFLPQTQSHRYVTFLQVKTLLHSTQNGILIFQNYGFL